MSLLDQAMREAYAAADRNITFIETLEINHPSFVDPIRVANNVDDDISLPLVFGGGPEVFVACPFNATPPGFDDDGPKEWQIEVHNASNLLSEHLEQTLTDNRPLDVIYRAYRKTDLTAPGEVIEGYKLKNVSLGPASATGTLYIEDLAQQAFPRATYNREDYPTLWG